jgi:hypothetical protein
MASLLGTELLEEAGVEITGIVDHDVDPAEFGDGVCDRGVCVLKAGDVELDSQQVLMAADRRRDLGRIATGCDNRMACGQRCLGNVEAQATACASDEPNLLVSHGKFPLMLGSEVMDYGPGQSMLTTIDLPVVAHVTRASAREPFLGMMLTLDARAIVQLAADIETSPLRKDEGYRSLSIEILDPALLDALTRLLALLEEPALLQQLAPLIQQEITIRLLAGPHGSYLRQLVSAGSPGQQIAKTVVWLKQNFARPMDVDTFGPLPVSAPCSTKSNYACRKSGN